jgi:hypothetical protein
MCFFVERVAGDEGESQGGLGVDHLFVGEIDLCSKEPEVRLIGEGEVWWRA